MQDLYKVLNSQTSKMRFLMGLAYLAKADGAIEESEHSFFLETARAMGLKEKDVSILFMFMTGEDTDLDITFPEKKQALFFLREAMQLCYLDGSFSEAEKVRLEEVSVKNGVTQENLNRIESWVREGMEWQRQGHNLLEME